MLAKEIPIIPEAAAMELTRDAMIRIEIEEAQEHRDLYSRPILVGGILTQMFGFIAVNNAAMYGCIVLGTGLLATGIAIFVRHQRRIGVLRAELAGLETETQP